MLKNAFIEKGYEVPADRGCRMRPPANLARHDRRRPDQAKGDGQLIAIIDSGLDVNHSAFKGDLDDSILPKRNPASTAEMTKMGEGVRTAAT